MMTQKAAWASDTGVPGTGEAANMRTAPVSREMILNDVAEHSLRLPRSY